MNRSVFLFLPVLALFSSPVARADGGAAHQVKQNPPVKMGTSGGAINDRNAARARSVRSCCGTASSAS